MTATVNELTIEDTWVLFEKMITENPEHIEGVATAYAIELSGEGGGSYGLTILNGEAKLALAYDEADCTLSMSVNDFKKLLIGKMKSTASYMMGKLKVRVSLGLALKLENLLKKFFLHAIDLRCQVLSNSELYCLATFTTFELGFTQTCIFKLRQCINLKNTPNRYVFVLCLNIQPAF